MAQIHNQDAALRGAAGQVFYNTSKFTLLDLKARASHQQLRANFEAYLDGFSPNVQDILEKFEFRNTDSSPVKGRRPRHTHRAVIRNRIPKPSQSFTADRGGNQGRSDHGCRCGCGSQTNALYSVVGEVHHPSRLVDQTPQISRIMVQRC